MPEIGQPAPDFALSDQHGEQVSLAQFRGQRNVLLVFFPFAFSGICTGELSSIEDRLPNFETADTVTLAVSVDHRFAQRAFADAQGYTFPLLADFWPHGAVAQAYGVFMPEKGAARRGSFLIDKVGVLRWSLIHEIGEKRDPAEYEKAVADLVDRP